MIIMLADNANKRLQGVKELAKEEDLGEQKELEDVMVGTEQAGGGTRGNNFIYILNQVILMNIIIFS